MNKNEAEQIIKKANETIENYNNLITSCQQPHTLKRGGLFRNK